VSAHSITPEERRQFEERGYFVREGVLPREACEALNGRLSSRIREVAEDYRAGRRAEWDFWKLLLRSAHGLEAFFVPQPGTESQGPPRPPLALPSEEWERLCARVGHGLHRADEEFAAASHAPAIAEVLRALLPSPARIAQTAVVYKQPRSEAVQFGFHQDAWYITLEPETLALAFVALDDMDAENGALRVEPGSHRDGLYERLAVGANGWEPLQPPRRFVPREDVLLPLPRGSAAFVHGRCFHASGPNRSDRPRRSFILHAFGGDSRPRPGCWIGEPDGGFTAL